MASFLAKQAAKKALKKATPFIREATNEIKKEGLKQAGNLQQAKSKCQRELQQCIKTETEKMKEGLVKIAADAGRKLQSGGRKRRSRKRKRSRTKKRRRR